MENRAKRIELQAMFLAEIGKSLRFKMLWTKHDVAEADRGIKPPPFVEQPSFAQEPCIDIRTRKRDKVIEGGEEELALERELARPLESAFRIVIVAEHERRVDRKMVAAQVGDAAHGKDIDVEVSGV